MRIIDWYIFAFVIMQREIKIRVRSRGRYSFFLARIYNTTDRHNYATRWGKFHLLHSEINSPQQREMLNEFQTLLSTYANMYIGIFLLNKIFSAYVVYISSLQIR